MRHENTVDLGVVEIHKKVIGDIAVACLQEVSGVRLADFGIVSFCAQAFGYKHYPAVDVSIDKDRQISLAIHVTMAYGHNIPLVARQIQDAIARAVQEAVEIHLKEINVNVQSVERQR